jgi:hypothetical protein
MAKFYLPILKAKAGEFTALSKLNWTIKSWVYPMFEITQIEYDNESGSTATTIEEHLMKLVKKILKCWPYEHSFIDIDLIKNELINGNSAIEYIYDLFAKNNVLPMPVARINMPDSLTHGFSILKQKYPINNIGIRVTIEDIDSPEFNQDLEKTLRSLSLSQNECHMIFDLMDSDFSETENFSDGVVTIISRFPSRDEWKSFTLAGGSFPITSKLKEGQQQIERGDWKLYNSVLLKLIQNNIGTSINFGDYSIVAPGHFAYDPIRMQTSASIRYTHNNSWVVIKGKSLKLYGYDQYFEISRIIKTSTFFLGQNYSEGDGHIFKCSPGVTTTGNPQVWKWVGNNHHITKVVNDLFSSPSDS